MKDITSIRALVIDLDGVLWKGKQPLPGVPEFFAALRRWSIPFLLVTNNSTVTPEAVQARLQAMGVEVLTEEILTSAQATAAWLRQRLAPGALVLPVGEAGLRTALSEAGFNLTEMSEGAKAVVVGMDRQISWDSLSEATLAIAAGAMFVGTNGDRSFPSERGPLPGAGALLAALQAASGKQPTVIGKPEPALFSGAVELLGTQPEQTLVLGDRLETDILGGQRAGLRTALVLTGISQPDELQSSAVQPDWVFNDLDELRRTLRPDLP